MDKEKMSALLAKEIQKLESEIAELTELTKPVAPENAIGRISRMDAINNKSINEVVLIRAKNKLLKLIEALNRMNEPGFGLCTRCGSPIPEGRLVLVPESSTCVGCTR